jgi:cell division septum initiation protein DivIVA
MSSMHTSPTTAESFAVVRKGFDREQVMGALTRLETETGVLRADRDAAVARAERAAADADRERARVAHLEARVAELGRAPVTSGQMSDRLSTMLSLATAEAESIRDSAHATADRIRAEAEEDAWRLREAAGSELADVRGSAEAIRAEHTAVLDAARARAREIILAAERDARRLDDEAARRRQEIDEDHRLASDLRRSETLREVTRQHDASLAAAESTRREAEEEARRLVDDAHRRADQLVSRARRHVDDLRVLRERVLDDLGAIRAKLEPVPGTGDDVEFDLPEEPDLNSSDG